MTTLYIEYKVLFELINFEEPTYKLVPYGLELKGASATFAHLANILFGLLGLIVTIIFYRKLRK